MANAFEAPPSIIVAVLNALAPYVGTSVITLALKEIFDRQRSRHQAKAKAPVNDAHARSLDGKTLREANQRMQELMEVIFELNTEVAAERRRADQAEMKLEWSEVDVNHWKLQATQAEARAENAENFTKQLNRAAKLKNVNLSDFSPKQLNAPEEDGDL